MFCIKHIDAQRETLRDERKKIPMLGGGVHLVSAKAGSGRNGFKLESLQWSLKHTKNHAAFSHLQHG